ncbi:MAG: NADH-quinone oxidoreductase subunit L, partial [Acidimicrobiales bacterium]
GVAALGQATAGLAARFDDRVVDPGIRGVAALGQATAGLAARFDDRVVDAGIRGVAALGQTTARLLSAVSEGGVDGAVRGLAGLVGAAGRDSRRLQTGLTHQYYVVVAAGVVALVAATVAWR